MREDGGLGSGVSINLNGFTGKHRWKLLLAEHPRQRTTYYYFDIQTPADGYKFRRVWYITDSKFLLEIYNEKNISTITVGHQFAIVDMATKKITYGIPN